jgi:hypothetical protein
VISVNKGDGATTLAATAGATNVLSLGAGIDAESLFFTKSGTSNLVMTDGVTGDSITFTNWYTSSANQVVSKLQVVEIASSFYNSAGTDALRNQALEEFNFASLVSQFNAAGSPANWALSNGMPSAQLASSATAAYGGDLAYYEGLNGNLTGMNLSAAQATLTNSAYATGTQTIDSWSSISGGGGIHLLAVGTGSSQVQVSDPASTDGSSTATPLASDATRAWVRNTASYVDPIRLAWLHADHDLGDASEFARSAAEWEHDPETLTHAALLSGSPEGRGRRRLIGDPGLPSSLARLHAE